MDGQLTLVSKQKGFVLIEMIVGIALAGLVLCSAVGTVYQIFIVNAQSTAHMKVVNQTESAIHWLSRDTMMAQNAITDDPDPATVVILIWAEWDNPGEEIRVTYTLDDGELRRNHSVNGQTIVARHIESATVDPKPYTGDELIFTITAALSGLRSVRETRVFEVIPRPSL